MDTIVPKYRYVREGSKRGNNHAFYFTIINNKIRVCKQFFKSTLNISDRPIRTVSSKTAGGILSVDFRGKHGHHFHLDENIKKSVKEHIETIPRIESHYCRQVSTREFIDGAKTVAQLHRDYVCDCKKKNMPFANYLMYSKIFNTEYNISFFCPKKDQCEDCVAFTNSDENEREILKEKYESHIMEKDLSRQEKEKDKNNLENSLFVAVYDLQAVLSCPRGEASGFYYLSKLSVYNFTICNLKDTKDVKCYVWYEGEGQRGVNEIGTCVFKYLQELEPKATAVGKSIDVVFYSDNCCGQQKNQFMIAMYRYAIKKLGFINSITHKFLIKGHTQNEGDSVHSVIEKNVSRTLKGGPIYTPDQYFTLIRTSKKNGQPYQVIELTHEDFFDIKSLEANLAFGNQNVKIGELRIVKLEKLYPNKMFYKTSFSEDDFSEIETKRITRRSNENNKVGHLFSLYDSKLPINEKKKKGLLTLFEKNIIPRYYSTFYNNL